MEETLDLEPYSIDEEMIMQVGLRVSRVVDVS